MRSFCPRPQGVSLAEILPKSHFFGGSSIHVSACCDTARLCRPGDLFVAIATPELDGHDDVEEAVRRGAAAILAERPLPVAVPTCVVRDSRAAFGNVCHALAGDPSQQLRSVGISGSHGKTVTSILVTSILEAAGDPVAVWNSLGSCDGFQVQARSNRVVSPPDLARWLATSRDHGCTHAVLEASSVNLASRRWDGVQLDAAILTNVRRSNLDFHGSVWNYRRAEKRLLDHLKPEGFAVINADDPGCIAMASQTHRPLITFGCDKPAEVTARRLEQHHGRQSFLLSAGRESILVRSAMVGEAHLSNCLAAAAVATVLGIDLPTIARGLEAVRCVPGRMESVCQGQDFPVYLDTLTTPDAVAMMLQSLRSVTRKRLICVLGVPTDRDVSDLPRFGRILERMADTCILTAADRRGKLPLEAAHGVLDGFDRAAVAQLIPDRDRAIAWALQKARSQDTVYILGRNHEQTIDPRACAVAEDDRALVSSTLGATRRQAPVRRAA